MVPLDPGLEEKTYAAIRETEEQGSRKDDMGNLIGKRVSHSILGEGTVIGLPRSGQGLIVQFDEMVTPRTFADSSKITFL